MLKTILAILILLFGLTFTSFAQFKPGITRDATTKVVKLFPNPATTSINFELRGRYDNAYTLQVFNFMGKKVYELVPSNQRVNVALDRFYRGVYIYQLRDKAGRIVESGRFQVIK